MNIQEAHRPAIEPTTALTLPQRAAVALKTSEHEIKLRELLTNSSRIVAPANKAARDECHAAYMVLKNTRCSITNLSEAVTEDAKSFTKAVKTEATRLLAITEAEESRLQGLRDAFDEQVAAEKAAKIKAERERTEAIEAAIQAIREIPISMAGKSSQDIGHCIDGLVGTIPDEFYQEFIERAQAARHEALDKLAAMETAQRGVEIEAESQRQEAARVAAEAEQARLAEAARLESERAELARLRADAERVVNEQAAERQRLADLAAAQELAAKQLRDKAAANLQAERDAQAEQMRIERERVSTEHAKAAAEIRAAQDKLASQQAAADARDAAALAAQQDAQRREDDHGPALAMNAEFDAAAALEQLPGAIAEMFEAMEDDSAHLARCTETAKAMLTNGRSLVQPESYSERDAMIDAADGMDSEPTDIEIIDVYVENFGGTRAQAAARLLAFVGDEVAA